MKYSNHKYKIIAFLLFVLLNSCISYKKTLYFQGDALQLEPPNLSETYVLKKRDMLQIRITSPETERVQNSTTESSQGSSGSNPYFSNYYIDDSGYVELMLIGKVKVDGYTIMQVDSLITQKVQEYMNQASVDVKFASFKFLALGEFIAPGQYYANNETCTIYEAFAIAGDVSMFSNKRNVQLIRTMSNGSKKIFHLNLTDYSTFTSENYFIQPNDILYVQPQRAKIDKQNVAMLSIGLSLISIALVVLSRIK